MTKPMRSYFACANSCQGFVNFFPSVLKNLQYIYLIKGGPGTGKSTLMKTVARYFWEKGEDVEQIFCSSDPQSLDGVVLCDRRIAIVDATAPHALEPTAAGAFETYVNLGEAWDKHTLLPLRLEIEELNAAISHEYAALYEELARAKTVHDQWEDVYLSSMDFEKLDQTAQTLQESIFADCKLQTERGTRQDRFFCALTEGGAVHYLEELTDSVKNRYFIKGRPGTGKSTLLKKIAAAAEGYGYDTEVYHCSFDPDSLDMVIVRDLELALFDATAPHEVFPSREGDWVIDLYEAAVGVGTDEANKECLLLIGAEYRKHMKRAREHLERAHGLHDRLEAFYAPAMDFSKVEDITKRLIQEIQVG